MPINQEIELKWTIQSEHLTRFKALPAIKKRKIGRAHSRKLVTVNFTRQITNCAGWNCL